MDPPNTTAGPFPASRPLYTMADLRFAARALLVAGTLAIFGQTVWHGFSCFDDPGYVADNARVAAGLTWQGLGWACTTGELSNWHPVTWLSYLLDAELCGLRPWGFHAVNVLLHATSAVLLFEWLCVLLAGAPAADGTRSSLSPTVLLAALTGAAFWAWHPLRVESVAWISQRKDLLSCLFGLLALRSLSRTWPEVTWAGVGQGVLFLALGLMSKPTLVTLPVTFALLVWCWTGRVPWAKVAILLLPSVVSAAITVHVQMAGGAMAMLAGLTLWDRAANACASVAAVACCAVCIACCASAAASPVSFAASPLCAAACCSAGSFRFFACLAACSAF